MKKFKNTVLTMVAVTSIGTTFVLTSPITANAAQNTVENITANERIQTKSELEDAKIPIENLVNHFVKNLNKYYPEKVQGTYREEKDPKIIYNHLTFNQFSVQADGSPVITNSENVYVGRETLTNNTATEQTLTTQSFSKTISHTVTSSTTHGFKFGTKATAKFNIPFVGETGIELSAEYDFSNTDSLENSESYTYIVSPQNIRVPAYSSVEVIVVLNTAKMNGNVKLLANASGTITASPFYTFPQYPNIDFYAYIENMKLNEIAGVVSQEHLKHISVNSDGETINVIGSGQYEAKYGTSSSVTVNPVNVKRNAADEGYTYNIIPTIEREN
ncbi:ETX/MTX2 family pore-forming toxin [Lysinibacillus fusiformis]|uniref:ETX/MTX2 family pore-forming toxin n=1 Tax=Lysinibacillus fusiformis TaxID=28031 RepID=UPI0020C0A6EB|nr:ETX/MTX2 family pore-forming toxin [Lysinibacillus fusiformis]